ncbi:MAG: LCP family protein [Streptosporangiaceae bacterium]
MSRYDEHEAAGWQQPGDSVSRAAGHRGRRIALIATGALASVVAVALVAGSLFAYVKYRQVYDGIKRVNVTHDLRNRPPADPNSLNILLIGSDTRSGENGAIGGSTGIQGARSDTVMLMHIAPGAHSVDVLSFPRDSVVPILACGAEDGTSGQTAQPGQVEQLNSTFAYGGPGCLWTTLEQTTHIRIDDFIELTFVGFEHVINDLNGVNVCLPAAVDDPMSGLNLTAGFHHIYGAQALAFWRTREDLGEGSDLQRIQRDQFLMAALVQGIEKSGLIRDPAKIASVLDDISSNHYIATDSELNPSRMLQIAEGLRGLSSGSVQFVEVPTQTYAQETAWVQWTSQATALFSAIAHDTRLPAAKPKASAVPSASPVATVSPSAVNVQVLNGSGISGVAATASTDLTSRGFNVVGSGNAASFGYTHSVIQYASAAGLPAGETLKAQLSGVTLEENTSLTPGTLNLILGSSFSQLKAPAAASPSSSASTSNLAQQYGGITGNVDVCHDSNAFAGPDGN